MAKIKMVPQCECGYVFDKVSIERVPIFHGSICFESSRISPAFCPNCGEAITSVTIPNIMDYVIDGEKSKECYSDRET